MQVYRGTPVNTEPSIHACMYINPYIRAFTRRWLHTRQMEPPMRVCVHPYMPGCTSVDTDAHCTDGHTTHARADMHGGGSARPRPATPPRPPPHQRHAERPSARRGIGLSASPDARAHTPFTHTHIRSRGLYICTHTCTHELAHTEIYV